MGLLTTFSVSPSPLHSTPKPDNHLPTHPSTRPMHNPSTCPSSHPSIHPPSQPANPTPCIQYLSPIYSSTSPIHSFTYLSIHPPSSTHPSIYSSSTHLPTCSSSPATHPPTYSCHPYTYAFIIYSSTHPPIYLSTYPCI